MSGRTLESARMSDHNPTVSFPSITPDAAAGSERCGDNPEEPYGAQF